MIVTIINGNATCWFSNCFYLMNTLLKWYVLIPASEPSVLSERYRLPGRLHADNWRPRPENCCKIFIPALNVASVHPQKTLVTRQIPRLAVTFITAHLLQSDSIWRRNGGQNIFYFRSSEHPSADRISCILGQQSQVYLDHRQNIRTIPLLAKTQFLNNLSTLPFCIKYIKYKIFFN